MYAICRLGKIKSQSQLSQAQGHNMRQRETFNADPLKSQQNEILHGSAFVRDDVNKRLEETGVKVRKDSVLCAEMILTASPEFFDTNVNIKQWEQENLKFLKDKYGENLINVISHKDEKSPHLHAIITPIIEGEENRLSMKEYMSGKKNLRDLQSDYAEAMKPFGLNRGIEKSVSKHQDIKSFYSNIEDAKNIADQSKQDFKDDMKVKIAINAPEPEGKIFKTISPDAAKQSTVEHLQTYKAAVNAKVHPLHEKLSTLSHENDRLRQENKDLKHYAAQMKQENDLSRKREQRFDHMKKLCPEEHSKLQDSYRNRLKEIEEKRKQEELLKQQKQKEEKQQLQERLQQQQARRPKVDDDHYQ